MAKNVYIHIPFCKTKCHYCSFISFGELNLKDEYVKALIEQIKSEYKGEKLNTLYFGGGTPSLLSVSDFEILLSLFCFEANPEITVEVNPDSVDFNFLQSLNNLGINRLSIGAQSFDDRILQLIGRRHNSAQILSALNCARKARFENISFDFIYGLPMQEISGFTADLNTAASLGVEHISLYGLKIEEGCRFEDCCPDDLPSIDSQADFYIKATELLSKSGFQHYEISNFSLNGFNSRHNLNYWDGNPYYGFGCAASGYDGLVRYTNQTDLIKYIKNPLERVAEEKLSSQERLEESIFLGLRKTAGINIAEINENYKIDFERKYFDILEKYKQYFIKTKDGYALTLNGILISNEILSEFVEL